MREGKPGGKAAETSGLAKFPVGGDLARFVCRPRNWGKGPSSPLPGCWSTARKLGSKRKADRLHIGVSGGAQSAGLGGSPPHGALLHQCHLIRMFINGTFWLQNINKAISPLFIKCLEHPNESEISL